VFGTNVIPTMLAQAARGEKDPEAAVAEAESQIQGIFDRWRSQGLVGGTR
jgi:multiple sugar transport system substrate-binding protein